MKLRKILNEMLLTEIEYKKGQEIWFKKGSSRWNHAIVQNYEILHGIETKLMVKLDSGDVETWYSRDLKNMEISITDPKSIPKIKKPRTTGKKYYNRQDFDKLIRGIRKDVGSEHDLGDLGVVSDVVENLLYDDSIVNYVANVIRRDRGNMNMSVKMRDIKDYIVNQI